MLMAALEVETLQNKIEIAKKIGTKKQNTIKMTFPG